MCKKKPKEKKNKAKIIRQTKKYTFCKTNLKIPGYKYLSIPDSRKITN